MSSTASGRHPVGPRRGAGRSRGRRTARPSSRRPAGSAPCSRSPHPYRHHRHAPGPYEPGCVRGPHSVWFCDAHLSTGAASRADMVLWVWDAHLSTGAVGRDWRDGRGRRVPGGVLRPGGSRGPTPRSTDRRAWSRTSTTPRSPAGRRPLRRAGHHWDRPRPHGLVDLALPANRPALLTGPRHERERAEPPTPRPAATVVHDLNADPRLPFADAAFDAAVCCVSVRLPHPPGRGVRRRSRGRCGRARRSSTTFSNRCFPDQGHPRLARVLRRAALRDRRPPTFALARCIRRGRRSSGARPRAHTAAIRSTRSGRGVRAEARRAEVSQSSGVADACASPS